MKTNVEKMSVFRLSMMLMKINDLHHSLHYVDENKGESRWTRAQEKVACSRSSLLPSMDATVTVMARTPMDRSRSAVPPPPRDTLSHIAYRPIFQDDEPIFDERRGGTGLQPAHCTARNSCATLSYAPSLCPRHSPASFIGGVRREDETNGTKGFSVARLTRLARIHNIFAPLSPAPWIPTGRECARGRRKCES